jgi:hypothetical protein
MDREGGIVEPIPSNGGRKLVTAFLSGGAVAIALAFAAALITLGGERRDVIDKVAEIPEIHDDLTLHIHDLQMHLNASEAVALTTLPLQLDAIQKQLNRVEAAQAETQAQLARLTRQLDRP